MSRKSLSNRFNITVQFYLLPNICELDNECLAYTHELKNSLEPIQPHGAILLAAKSRKRVYSRVVAIPF